MRIKAVAMVTTINCKERCQTCPRWLIYQTSLLAFADTAVKHWPLSPSQVVEHNTIISPLEGLKALYLYRSISTQTYIEDW